MTRFTVSTYQVSSVSSVFQSSVIGRNSVIFCSLLSALLAFCNTLKRFTFSLIFKKHFYFIKKFNFSERFERGIRFPVKRLRFNSLTDSYPRLKRLKNSILSFPDSGSALAKCSGIHPSLCDCILHTVGGTKQCIRRCGPV